MKNVFLVRHAKAENLKEGLSDFSRSLLKEGMNDAKCMAKKIRDKISGTMMFISSPASRALETAHIFAEKLDYPIAKILLKDSVYSESSPESFIALLHEIEDSYDTAVLFGHNPAISDFASVLINGFEFDIPKSGVLAFEFAQSSWKEIGQHTGILKCVEYPSEKCGKENQFQRMLSAKISFAISEILNRINPDSSKSILKSVEKHAGKTAKNFTKELRRKPHEKSADQ
jgi:phosphohistidine phosphatase